MSYDFTEITKTAKGILNRHNVQSVKVKKMGLKLVAIEGVIDLTERVGRKSKMEVTFTCTPTQIFSIESVAYEDGKQVHRDYWEKGMPIPPELATMFLN